MKLLILGPDEARTVVAQRLEAEGVEVQTASVGREGAAVLAESPWNVMVMVADQPSGEIPPLEEIERRHIELVLKEVGFNMSKAARILGIDRTTLYNKQKKYGFQRNLSMAASVDS